MIEIKQQLIEAFSKLCMSRKRGETIEIITPLATITDNLVSIFFSQEDNKWIISDGGWLMEGRYLYLENISPKVIEYFSGIFNVQKINSSKDTTIYYRDTDKEGMLTSIAYDVSLFIQSVVNTSKYLSDTGNNLIDEETTNLREI